MVDPDNRLGMAFLGEPLKRDDMIIRTKSLCGVVMAVCLVLSTYAYGARVKDIAGISGVRDNQLVGYGLVVGLAGTGDDVKNGFTKETLANLLSRQGLGMKEKTLKSDNAAAVTVTALLPPFAKVGTKLDVIVSSIGDAKSLQGGTLVMTPLRGTDGEVYAVAQGAIVLGGFVAGGAGGGGAVKNHPNVARISNGALVEREIKYEFDKSRKLTINLLQPDFTTATRLAAAINNLAKGIEARQIDSSSVAVRLPEDPQRNVFEVIYAIENMDIPVDSQAVVVLNEKTGTVVMGENVRISTVAVAHGNLSIQIKEEKKVSQPLPLAPSQRGGAPVAGKEENVIIAPGGQTVVTTEKSATATEEKNKILVVPQGVTIQDVVKALNAIGVSPRDLISIIQTLKAAGALQADLRII